MLLLALLAALVTLCGLVAVGAGAMAVRHFTRQARTEPNQFPAVTVLRPLCGTEPLLETALALLCGQVYPGLQIVFGVQSSDDAALAIVHRVRQRFPEADITVVVSPILHGRNRKVSNLINMLPSARHDMLVFSDSDLHVAPDYVARIVAALEKPNVGLVTTLCGGLPTVPGIASRLGATAMSHSFLPGALLSRALGREDGLAATMALRRDTLVAVGGLEALVAHLADDNVLAQRVRQLGLRIGLADTVPSMAVPDRSLRVLWQHELRWARTIRALAPLLFAMSAVQFPLFWAVAALALSGGAGWSLALLAGTWIAKAAAAQFTDRALFRAWPAAAVPLWLLPMRDFLSVCLIVASYLGNEVIWRGNVMHADNGRPTAGNRAAAS